MKIKTNINNMAILKQFVFIFCLLVLFIYAEGQKKYALLIGINDYYEVKGIKSKESLNGSVNDARAIKDLLEKKFGIPPANIDTIYNAAATRDNIIEGLKKKLQQCKTGDLMVFYYSGHGVWMENSQLKNDKVKRGMNQAMLTSDLYSYRDQFKCFLRDFTLKTYFNYFIDKKVMVTSMFDCCFSGNLVMTNVEAISEAKAKSVDFNELMGRLTEESEDSQRLIDSISGITTTTPLGCTLDSTGAVMEKQDSDLDGVPDCRDKEKLTDNECMPVNADGVGKCAFDFVLQKTLNKHDAVEFEKSNLAVPAEITTKGYNASEVRKISEIDTIARPTERKKSKFLFIGATTDAQKALEFKDQKNEIHGFFTASLLRVFSKYSIDIPASELFEKIKQDMATFKIDQNPTLYSDPDRLQYNLIGNKLKPAGK